MHGPGAPIDVYRQVSVGRHTYGFAPATFALYSASDRIEIGAFCSIHHETRILANGVHRLDRASTWPFEVLMHGQGNAADQRVAVRPTRIGNDVYVGTGAVVVGERQVGDGAVIAAGSVVAHDVAPYAIVAGNPARVIGTRVDDAVATELQALAWWTWDDDTLASMREAFAGDVAGFLDAATDLRDRGVPRIVGTQPGPPRFDATFARAEAGWANDAVDALAARVDALEATARGRGAGG